LRRISTITNGDCCCVTGGCNCSIGITRPSNHAATNGDTWRSTRRTFVTDGDRATLGSERVACVYVISGIDVRTGIDAFGCCYRAIVDGCAVSTICEYGRVVLDGAGVSAIGRNNLTVIDGS
jgi:hypothetical protein